MCLEPLSLFVMELSSLRSSLDFSRSMSAPLLHIRQRYHYNITCKLDQNNAITSALANTSTENIKATKDPLSVGGTPISPSHSPYSPRLVRLYHHWPRPLRLLSTKLIAPTTPSTGSVIAVIIRVASLAIVNTIFSLQSTFDIK